MQTNFRWIGRLSELIPAVQTAPTVNLALAAVEGHSELKTVFKFVNGKVELLCTIIV